MALTSNLKTKVELIQALIPIGLGAVYRIGRELQDDQLYRIPDGASLSIYEQNGSLEELLTEAPMGSDSLVGDRTGATQGKGLQEAMEVA